MIQNDFWGQRDLVSIFFFFFFFKFYFIFKLYITVLDLPNIKMNPPQVYMCSQQLTRNFLRIGPCISVIFIHRQPLTCGFTLFSHVQLCMTLWTTACKAPLSMGFSRQEYWSGLPCPSPGDLPDPGIEPMSLISTCIGRQVLYHWCHLESPSH